MRLGTQVTAVPLRRCNWQVTSRRALSTVVPGAFPNYAYSPEAKSVGSAEYERLQTNWAECVPFRHSALASPSDLVELQQVVKEAEKLRVVGSAHSFSHLADAPGATMLSLAFMARIGEIDPDAMTVTAEGGVTLGELCRYLAPRDCALHNVASFPHLTWVGAAATGSHGSGVRLQGFQGYTAALDFVLPNGDIKRYDRETCGEEEMASVAVGLGCLGPVSSVSVDICPSYDITQQCYRMPVAEYLENFHAMVAAHDSVSTFANFGDGVVEWTFQRDKIEPGSVDAASFNPPPLIHNDAGSLITTPCKIYESDVEHPGTGVFNWHDGLHFFMHGCRDDPMPYIGLQSEWFVSMEDAVPALEAAIAASKHWPGWGTDPLEPGKAPVVIISELRQIAADPGFMSPTPKDSLSIHFTFGHHPVDVMHCVAQIEKALAPFDARPHWGKLFTPSYMTKERVARLYPELPKFVELCMAHDPQGKFRSGAPAYILIHH